MSSERYLGTKQEKVNAAKTFRALGRSKENRGKITADFTDLYAQSHRRQPGMQYDCGMAWRGAEKKEWELEMILTSTLLYSTIPKEKKKKKEQKVSYHTTFVYTYIHVHTRRCR